MMTFSTNPDVAEQQMRALIFYLTAFGYIDGEFDLSEKTFIRSYIRELVDKRARQSMPQASDASRSEVVDRFTTHFHEVFQEVDYGVRSLFDEVVAKGEDTDQFVYAKLKLRCYEIFKAFDEDNQKALLETVDELITADGHVHPAEAKFRDEVRELLVAEIALDDGDLEPVASDLEIDGPAAVVPREDNHPFFSQFETHYSADPVRIRKQAELDFGLISRAMQKFDEQRAAGEGKLAGHNSVAEFSGEAPFLDGHVYVEPLVPGQRYELTVLGDLHGCYSCLKGALMQSDFFAKVEAFRIDPQNNPNPKLILLGDYIDRGRFSYNGVLRTVLQLFLTAPDHVYVLRGNHEYYLEYQGRIYGGVKPAEAINSLVGYMPQEMFEAYMNLFDALPNILLFGKTVFVHAGIPRDDTFEAKYTDLASLNDDEMRFQMLWSDPSQADFIPRDLQAQNARFPFGKLQFHRFASKLGCNTLVRGHEKVIEGFRRVYDDGNYVLLNLFSAGGADNNDLPPDSSYREVTPMALTMSIDGKASKTKITPWAIDYQRYNDPAKNAFFKSEPEIAHKG
jgi:uncharacterized tellurite resistance protein B-like protein